MAKRLSDSREHRTKWAECFRTAALLARSKAATYLRMDGTPSDDGAAWAEIAVIFERTAKGCRRRPVRLGQGMRLSAEGGIGSGK